MQNKTGRPDGFVIYRRSLQSVCLLPEEQAGRVFHAAARFFLDGQEPETLDLSEQLVYSLLRDDIDSAMRHHAAICARNQRIAASRKAPVVTTGDQSLPVAPNTNTNTNLNLNTNTKGGTGKPPTRTRFVPPSVEEVAVYCKERQNGIDARRFFDYYTANGWTQGRGKPIRDWRAAVRTWERRDEDGTNHSGDGYSAADTDTIEGITRL